MPVRPCLTCGTLTTGSYCPRHRPSRRSAARGSGGRQDTFRRRVLAKHGNRCAACGSTENVEAHHVQSLAFGGTHAGEGVPLCRRCHRHSHR